VEVFISASISKGTMLNAGSPVGGGDKKKKRVFFSLINSK
jgi:hypothetical protein